MHEGLYLKNPWNSFYFNNSFCSILGYILLIYLSVPLPATQGVGSCPREVGGPGWVAQNEHIPHSLCRGGSCPIELSLASHSVYCDLAHWVTMPLTPIWPERCCHLMCQVTTLGTGNWSQSYRTGQEPQEPPLWEWVFFFISFSLFFMFFCVSHLYICILVFVLAKVTVDLLIGVKTHIVKVAQTFLF